MIFVSNVNPLKSMIPTVLGLTLSKSVAECRFLKEYETTAVYSVTFMMRLGVRQPRDNNSFPMKTYRVCL